MFINIVHICGMILRYHIFNGTLCASPIRLQTNLAPFSVTIASPYSKKTDLL